MYICIYNSEFGIRTRIDIEENIMINIYIYIYIYI